MGRSLRTWLGDAVKDYGASLRTWLGDVVKDYGASLRTWPGGCQPAVQQASPLKSLPLLVTHTALTDPPPPFPCGLQQTTEGSLVFLRRALLVVSLSVIVASIVIMKLSDNSFKTAVVDEASVHSEGDLADGHAVGEVSRCPLHRPHSLMSVRVIVGCPLPPTSPCHPSTGHCVRHHGPHEARTGCQQPSLLQRNPDHAARPSGRLHR